MKLLRYVKLKILQNSNRHVRHNKGVEWSTGGINDCNSKLVRSGLVISVKRLNPSSSEL
jgi:hypothetical protein